MEANKTKTTKITITAEDIKAMVTKVYGVELPTSAHLTAYARVGLAFIDEGDMEIDIFWSEDAE